MRISSPLPDKDAEIARLQAQVERLTKDNRELLGRPSPYSKAWSELTPDEGARIIRERIGEWFRGSHYVNALVRRNAADEVHEADWLKYVPGFVDQLAKAEAVVRAMEEHGRTIQRKCEQYWNEPVPEAAEFHAILEFIHREAAACRERA